MGILERLPLVSAHRQVTLHVRDQRFQSLLPLAIDDLPRFQFSDSLLRDLNLSSLRMTFVHALLEVGNLRFETCAMIGGLTLLADCFLHAEFTGIELILPGFQFSL